MIRPFCGEAYDVVDWGTIPTLFPYGLKVGRVHEAQQDQMFSGGGVHNALDS